jgi:hypothetical protein
VSFSVSTQYEHGVPVGLGKLFLLEYGETARHWMDGMKVTMPIGRSRKKAEVIIKVIPDENNENVELEHASGCTEKQSYANVVLEIFAEVKRAAKKSKMFRPFPSGHIKLFSSADRPVSVQEDAPATRKRAITKRIPAGSNKMTSSHTDVVLPCSSDDFVTDPWLSDLDDDEVTLIQGKEMSNSIRSSFWKALNSSEASYGYELLLKMTSFHNKIPNDELCRDLIELLWKGPLHKKVRFPDCVRLEMLNNYLKLLKSKGVGSKLTKVLLPTFAQEVLEQVENPAAVYCVEGDESRLTEAALLRVGQTLNVKNSGASLLCYLLQLQLQGYQRFGANGEHDCNLKKEMEVFKERLLGRDLTSDILKYGGAKALKLTVRATFSILIHYGHYLSSDFEFPRCKAVDPTSEDRIPPHASSGEQAFVAAETRCLVKHMGQLCSYMAWIYCIDQGVSLYETRYVIRDVVEGMLSSSSFDPSIFLKDTKGIRDHDKRLLRHWNDMKLQFALSLDKRISGHLGKHTASLFNCATHYF